MTETLIVQKQPTYLPNFVRENGFRIYFHFLSSFLPKNIKYEKNFDVIFQPKCSL